MQAAQLSPIELFMQAGLVVKGVIVLLALSSIWCWAIIVRCRIGLAKVKRAASRLAAGAQSAMVTEVLNAGSREAALDYVAETSSERHARVSAAMRRQIQVQIETEQSGLANLAVISSVAPFIGLFGTVWGIMTSFIGIAAAKDTSLAVVAPGIAEALFATAVGLAAAIPAAFAYNRLASAFTLAARRYARLTEDRAHGILHASPLVKE